MLVSAGLTWFLGNLTWFLGHLAWFLAGLAGSGGGADTVAGLTSPAASRWGNGSPRSAGSRPTLQG
jgi:hypothetical protein